ncbi:unnamed protein product [Blepharisma stoltei]|uniref:Neurobeachin beta-propeller domain-containing protein n=1 Tax=Blepharisma stoltei TaxID=1481888 RepID=A0AAU9K579_9CILI|nr:unnamed protein product [Blepharisma stoltei]
MYCNSEGCQGKPAAWCECQNQKTLICQSHIASHLQTPAPNGQIHFIKVIEYKSINLSASKNLIKTVQTKREKLISSKEEMIKTAHEEIFAIEARLKESIRKINDELENLNGLICEIISISEIPNIPLSPIREILSLPDLDAAKKLDELLSAETSEFADASPSLVISAWKSAQNTIDYGSLHECCNPIKVSSKGIRAVSFSPSGHLFATAGLDSNLRLWNFKTQTLVATYGEHDPKRINSIAFHPTGSFVVSSSADNTMILWTPFHQKSIKTFKGHEGSVRSVCFSPDGYFIASGSNDKTVKYWFIAQGLIVHSFRGHLKEVTCVTFSPSGRFIASGSADSTVKIWKIAERCMGTEIKSEPGEIKTISYSHSGNLIAWGGENRAIWLYFFKTKTSSKLAGHTDTVESLVFSHCDNFIISGAGDKIIIVWDLRDNRQVRVLRGHSAAVRSLAFSPCGKYIISSSEDGCIKTWGVDETAALGQRSKTTI